MRIEPQDLAQRVEDWQQRLAPLGLAHWRIRVVSVTDDVPGKMFAHAGVSVVEDYDTVDFHFNASWIDGASAKELDETILHEWCHVAMRDLTNAIDLARPWFPEATWDTFDTNLDHHRETLVDRMSRQLYAFAKPNSHPRTTK